MSGVRAPGLKERLVQIGPVPVVGGLAAGILVTQQPQLVGVLVGAVLGGALVVWASIRWPRVALLSCLGVVLIGGMKFRIRPPEAVFETGADAQILFELAMYAAVGVAACLSAFRLGLHRRRLRLVEWGLVAYVLWVLASVTWSDAPRVSGVRAVQLVVLGVLVLSVGRAFVTERWLTTAAWLYTAFVLGMALIALTVPGAAGGRVDYFTGGLRFAWFADHPITVAMHAGLAAILLVAVLSYAEQRRLGRDALGVVALALCIAVLLATGSRGPAGALLASFALMYAARWFTPAQALLAGLLILGLTCATLLIPGPPRALLEVLDLGSTPLAGFALRGADLEHLIGFSGRLELWTGVFEVAKEAPLLGFGFVASRPALLEILPWAGHAHSGPLQSMLDVGLIGALMLWTMVSVQLVRFLVTPPEQAAQGRARLVVLGVLSFLVIASVTDPGIAGPPGPHPMLGFLALLIPQGQEKPA